MCDSIEHFQNFGEGIYFYFYFLKYMAVCFLIMTLFAVPIIYFLLTFDEQGFKSTQSIFVRSSLSNFLALEIEEGSDQATISIQTEEYRKESSKYFYIFQGLDLGYSFLLWVAVLVLKFQMNRKRKEIQKKCLTVQKFSLLVNRVPEGVGIHELKEFFGRFSEVVDVNAIFDFKGALGDVKKLAKKIIERRACIKKVNNPPERWGKIEAMDMKRKVAKIDRKIDEEIAKIHKIFGIPLNGKLDVVHFSNLKILHAFATFRDPAQMQAMFLAFKEEYKRRCCRRKPVDPKFYLKGRKVRLKRPDIPSNINWENIGYSKWRRFFRICLIVILIAVLLVLSTALVLGLTSVRETSRLTLQNAANDCVEKISLENFEKIEEKTDLVTYCFCVHQSKLELFQNSKVNGYCLGFITEQGLIYAKQIGAAAAISVVDLLFAILIVKIIKFVRICYMVFYM